MSKVPYGLVPLYPYINLKIGKVDISSDPQKHIMDFSCERVFSGCKFNFTLYDDTALLIEDAIAKTQGGEEVTFKYGYNGDANYTSTTYKGHISEYSLSFEAGGIVLDIQGVSEDTMSNVSSQESREYKSEDYNGSQSNVVRAVAAEMGWEIGNIVDTQPFLDETGNPATFIRNNETAKAFIERLCEDSVSEDGEHAGYRCYFDSSNRLYFEPLDYSVEVPKDYAVIGDYEYYCGKSNQAVLSFSPDYKGPTSYAAYANPVAESVDKLSNTIINNSVLGISSTKAGRVFRTVMGESSTDPEILKNRIASMSRLYSAISYTATMEVMGDLDVELGKYIRVLVYTKYSFLHHTSGTYQIQSISDEISGGSFTTSLTLIKAADLNGDSGVSYNLDGANTNYNGSQAPGSAHGNSTYTGLEECGVAKNPKVEAAVQWAIGIAENNNIGYSWGNGNSTTGYDCSGLVNNAFANGGFGLTVGQHGSGTSAMRATYQGLGFTWFPGPIDVNKLERGDILLAEGSHTEIYIGGGKNVGAHSNYDGVTGDTGDKEINVKNYYDAHWNGYLRYNG